jgi:hypothetical protein
MDPMGFIDRMFIYLRKGDRIPHSMVCGDFIRLACVGIVVVNPQIGMRYVHLEISLPQE